MLIGGELSRFGLLANDPKNESSDCKMARPATTLLAGTDICGADYEALAVNGTYSPIANQLFETTKRAKRRGKTKICREDPAGLPGRTEDGCRKTRTIYCWL
jgi:hypothetical protein